MKKPHSVGYFSAYYRGLKYLLDMWPEIRKQVPDATLDVYYGWESWLAIQGEDEFYHTMEQRFEDMKSQGVTVHGRVSHKELAKAMQETQVFAYPTEFHEIFAITAVKVNAAHMKPVITEVAALKETGGPVATRIETQKIGSDQYKQQKFVEAVVKALETPPTKDEMKTQDKWVEQWTWTEIAKQWQKEL